MKLPGGILVDGVLRRDVRLAPLDGTLELALAEAAEQGGSQPEQVSRFLGAALAGVGGCAPDPDALSVGDRQHLARTIGARLGPDLIWLTGTCRDCGADFDLPIRQSELPVKPAGAGYPVAEVALRGRPIRVRVPTGCDQVAVARLDEHAGVLALIDRLVEVEEPIPAAELDEAEVAALESAVEAAAVEVATEADTECPECGAKTRIPVDPYLALFTCDGSIFREIDTLARHYHWSEAEILALPQGRRKRYLSLIDRARGMAGPGSG